MRAIAVARNLRRPLARMLSASSEGKYRTIQLDAGPMNVLTPEVLQSLIDAAKEANDENETGVVLRGSDKIFSAGLDLNRLYQPDKVELAEYWRLIQDFFFTFYGSSVPIVSAIEGHAPAGGCFISLCTSYRVMANDEKLKIGLNESQLGLAPPWWFNELLSKYTGPHASERLISHGTLLSPSQALDVGMVDEIVDKKDVYSRACAELDKHAKVPFRARGTTSQFARRELLEKLLRVRDDDIDYFVENVASDSMQKSLDAYMASLGSKK